MSGKQIGVLVVDDSVLIREMISDRIAEESGMAVVGTAADGRKALAVLDRVCPDVVTLDVQMPNMDGLATLDAILARQALPVIMVSSLTQLGADTTLEALDRGALDYVAKPGSGSGDESQWREDLVRKIRSAAGSNVTRVLEIRRERKQRRAARPKVAHPKPITNACPEAFADKCIAIGISTGGPPALAGLFEGLRPPMPPIVVVQHMPPQFTRAFAWRLDSLSALSVREAADGDPVRPNHVLIAPGGRHLELRLRGGQVKAVVRDAPPVSGHKPSADVLMRSVATLYGPRCMGVIMTGMGRDGSDGCRAIRAAGGYVLGQDEASSDVYGMNRVAFVEGNVDRQFSLNEAAATIGLQIRRLWMAAQCTPV